MEFKLEETNIFQEMALMVGEKNYDLSPNDAILVIDSFIYGFANFLSIKKSKDKPVVVGIVNDRNDIIMAMAAEYQLNEEDEEKSNWYVWMTLDSNDINEKESEVYRNTDGLIIASVSNTAMNRHSISFKDALSMNLIGKAFVDALKKYLDVNANPEEKVSVTSDLFIASVAVEDDIKAMAIVPGEDIKRTVAKTPRD